MPMDFSEALTSLFPSPSHLPGGVGWNETCVSIYGPKWTFTGDNCEQQLAQANVTVCSNPMCDVGPAFGFVQVFLLFVFYGYILFQGSVLISDGSELLLLVPSWRGLVGTLVLPILGAVPDGAIVLFSGIGANARQQIQVGVGALAGSTIMLLTVPWCLSIFGGAVQIKDGEADYKHKRSGGGCLKSGVTVDTVVKTNALIMLATATPYFLVQIPAFIAGGHGMATSDKQPSVYKTQASVEKYFSLAACVLAVLFFIAYLVYCFFDSKHSDEVNEKAFTIMKRKLASGEIDLVTLFKTKNPRIGHSKSATMDYETLAAQNQLDAETEHLKRILRRYFDYYDTDKSGALDRKEFIHMMRALGITDADTEWNKMDADNNGTIAFDEFTAYVKELVDGANELRAQQSSVLDGPSPRDEEEGDAEDSDEEVDESLFDEIGGKKMLNMSRVKRKAFLMMGVGTMMVLLFSDPMCDVLNEFGDRIGIAPFFIAFVFAPLASNASEVIASYSYAQKKSKETITVSFTALEGAAIMNNTFCTAIFFGLIFAQDLAWTFAAETIAIIFVQLVMFGFGFVRTHSKLYALLVLCLYPISLLLVAGLEAAGLD